MKFTQTPAARRITPILLVAACVAVAAEPIKAFKAAGQMSYPLWQDGCVLANVSAVDAKVTANVGESVATKHGTWRCTRVVADQKTGDLAAAWIPVGN